MLVASVSLPSDINENVETLRRDLTFTHEDHRLLTEFSIKALQSRTITDLKIT